VKITIVGAILTIAGIVVGALVLHALFGKGNRNPKPNNPRWPEGEHPGSLGA
jgi:hypothetical protein